MPQKIILSSEEVIECPQCQHKFALGEGITRQTIERYEQDFEAVLKERSAELRQELEKEAERKLYSLRVSSCICLSPWIPAKNIAGMTVREHNRRPIVMPACFWRASTKIRNEGFNP
jgi:hypothetical protein